MERFKEARECISTKSYEAIQESQEYVIKNSALAKSLLCRRLTKKNKALLFDSMREAKAHLERIADILRYETEQKREISFLTCDEFLNLALPLDRMLNNSDYYSKKSEKLDYLDFLHREMLGVKKDIFY